MRWNDWKVNFAGVTGNIATGVRDVTSWPLIVNLKADPYENMPFHSEMYMRWYADNIWLFVPVGAKIKEFLATLQGFPFQEGSSMNPAGINYNTLKAAAALKHLQKWNHFTLPQSDRYR